MLITNATLVLPNEILSPAWLALDGNTIDAFGQGKPPQQAASPDDIALTPDCSVLPGFIDTHIHGIGGADVMDATDDALASICSALPATGTTAFLATTLSAPTHAIAAALSAVRHHQPQAHHAQILGVHLEGPFISKHHHGAHSRQWIIEASPTLFNSWHALSAENIKLLTLAPEVSTANAGLVEHIAQCGVMPAIGHSGANRQHCQAAYVAGARHITHLYNAMGSRHHRQAGFKHGLGPAIADFAFAFDDVRVELIVDHHHLHADTVNHVYQHKTASGIVLVTDAMRATCLGHGTYRLGQAQVCVAGGKATLADGRLAGSVLTLDAAVRHTLAITGCSLLEIATMTALGPAEQCGALAHKGSISVGKDADLVILDAKYEVMMTLCRGQVAYARTRNHDTHQTG